MWPGYYGRSSSRVRIVVSNEFMKTPPFLRPSSFIRRHCHPFQIIVPVAALLLPALTAPAITFTNDIVIPSYDTNYDGADVVITTATVTVDGVHTFASLQVLNGGNFTHTFAGGGSISNWRTVTNELQVLSVTNLATLSNANVTFRPLWLQDWSGQITYTNDVDYLVGFDTNNVPRWRSPPTQLSLRGARTW